MKTLLVELYKNCLSEVFNPEFFTEEDIDPDPYLTEAIQRDVHNADEAPGQWSQGLALVEIYCESGIPNASDYFDPAWYGHSGKVSYNAEKWNRVDDRVNEELQHRGFDMRVYHEPVNNAVVCIYPI